MKLEIKKKILLVLDLDETLIHATEQKLKIDIDFQYANYFVYIRPYLEWFLETMSANFKLAIWSSADDKYVKEIVEKIKPEILNLNLFGEELAVQPKEIFSLTNTFTRKDLKK